MSAFAVIYQPSNTPGAPGVFSNVMERLSHRGPDGKKILSLKGITMGYWRFWITPEENGEQQPLNLQGTPFHILFDGRIDNRDEILSILNITKNEASRLSDAALTLRAYARWGDDCFQHFVGEFALVIYNEQKHELTCVRDQLGDRTLFYAVFDHQVVIASEPWAAAGADSAQPQINERAIAHYFAISVPEDGQTFLKNIHELLPAQILKFNADGKHVRCYWQPNFDKKIRYKTDEEYAEYFRQILDESIKNQMRSISPIGVLMSGGLDSTAVASLAAQRIAPQQLTTISYVFDRFPECDERAYINTVQKKYNLRSIQIPCDDAVPYRDLQSYTPNPNEPFENPYRQVHELAFSRAHKEGLRVILNGGFGDHLYASNREWFADLVMEGRFITAWSELRDYGIRSALQARYPQRILRRVVDALPGGKNIYRRSPKPHWLTSYAKDLLPNITRPHPKLERHLTMLGLQAANYNSHFFFKAGGYGLELRSPYRDRRLVEFMLALPAYQIYHRKFNKYILRTALKDILPEKIALRTQPTSLLSFLFHGVEEQKHILKAYADSPEAAWRKYINGQWLQNQWDKEVSPDRDGPEVLALWLAVSYEKWQSIFSMN